MKIKVIKPKPYDIPRTTEGLRIVLDSGVAKAEELYKPTYQNWDNQPTFKKEGPKVETGDLMVEYSTEDVPFVWVDGGTEEHPIAAKNPSGVMRFTIDGSPKTQPGKLHSGPGQMGSDWRTAKELTHPGIEPRGFTEEVIKEVEPQVHEDTDKVIREAR
jgi:hypothetical protein